MRILSTIILLISVSNTFGQQIVPPPGQVGIPMFRTLMFGPLVGERLLASFEVHAEGYLTVVTIEAEDLAGAAGQAGTTYQEIGRWLVMSDRVFHVDIAHNRWYEPLRSYRFRAVSLRFLGPESLPSGYAPWFYETSKTITSRLPLFGP